MTDIIVPYAFVPISKWVFHPDWSYQVSHDLPFADGVTGAIDLTLKNATELCVGGSTNKNSKSETSGIRWATTPEEDGNKLIIPGSSIKGMLRNIIEIAGFGKFKNYVDRNVSFRELVSESDYMKCYKEYNVVSCFLNRDKDGWYIVECSNAKMANESISTFLETKITNYDKEKLADANSQQSAVKKFELAKERGFDAFNMVVEAEIDTRYTKQDKGKIKVSNHAINIKKAEDNDSYAGSISTTKKGFIVFGNYRIVTPSKEQDIKNKDYSYYFYDIKATNRIRLTDSVVDNFRNSQNREQIDYLFRNYKRELGVPVWALKKNNKVEELGVCRMPRLNCKNSVGKLAVKSQKDCSKDFLFDLSDILFGTIYTNDATKTNMSLKSRVSCSDFISDKKVNCGAPVPLCLQGPKISFRKGYLTKDSYHSDSAELMGWKRYKIMDRLYKEASPRDVKDTQKSLVSFAPKETSFKGRILFHNLKPFEIGALLWTIKFMPENDCYHSLGHGKPYGAGAVRFSDINLVFPSYDKTDHKSVDQYIELFVNTMNKLYPSKDNDVCGWMNSPQIKNLIEISKPNENKVNAIYNKLSEFSNIDKHIEYLEENVDNLDMAKCNNTFSMHEVVFLSRNMKVSDKDIGQELVNKWKEEQQKNEILNSGISEEYISIMQNLDELAKKLERFCGTAEYNPNDSKVSASIPKQNLKPAFLDLLNRFTEKEPDKIVLEKFVNTYDSNNLAKKLIMVPKSKSKDEKLKEEAKKFTELYVALKDRLKDEQKTKN